MYMATIEEKELRREMQRRKDEAVCADYRELSKKYPNEKAYTLFDTLAAKYRKGDTSIQGVLFPITVMGVRDIIIRNGLYTPRKYNKQ